MRVGRIVLIGLFAAGCGAGSDTVEAGSQGQATTTAPPAASSAAPATSTTADTATTVPSTGATATTAPVCPGEPGSPTDLSEDPDYGPNTDLVRWTTASGCPVSYEVLVTFRPGADFHCAPWPPSISMGTPLGARMGDDGGRRYTRDPEGRFDDPELQAGFDGDAALPASAVDSGYRQDGVELWTDPGDDSFIYLVGPDTTERWPLQEQPPGCA